MGSLRAAVFSILLSASACGPAEAVVTDGPSEAEVDDVEQAFTDGAGPLRGHEDLTRLSVNLANIWLKVELGRERFFPAVTEEDTCLSASHPMVQGNCATDFPDATMLSTYGVAKSEWQTAASVQDLHFLRDHVGTSSAVSARAACVASRGRIVEATRRAVAAWRAGDVTRAQYWLGHAQHIIQDSFSPAHTPRVGPSLHTLADVCTYGRTVAGVCRHAKVDARDRIWLDTPSCQLNPLSRGQTCLSPGALQAMYASTGYLRTFAKLVTKTPEADVATALTPFFEQDSEQTGGFRCSTLLPATAGSN